MEEQDAPHPVGRVGDLHLDARHPPLQVAPQPVLVARLPARRLGVDAVGDAQAHALLELTHHRVVVVIAGQEDHAPAAHPLTDEVEESLGLSDGVVWQFYRVIVVPVNGEQWTVSGR